jgi:hypothetical protein
VDIITIKANRKADNFFRNTGRFTDYKELIDSVERDLLNIDNSFDQIKFLNTLLVRSNNAYEVHKPHCTKPSTCLINYAFENVAYFVSQKLKKLGFNFNEDTFNINEKNETDLKIDEILEEISKLKAGQQVIWEDVLKELEELKELHFLGKKKWYQLLVGKSVDMVAGGIVSETVAKQIIESFRIAFPKLGLPKL